MKLILILTLFCISTLNLSTALAADPQKAPSASKKIPAPKPTPYPKPTGAEAALLQGMKKSVLRPNSKSTPQPKGLKLFVMID